MSEWEFIAPMVLGITVVVSAAGVLILRPLTKRLGDMLEAMRHDRQARAAEGSTERLISLVERLSDRMELLEERQDFTERMITASRRDADSRAALREPAEG